MKRLAGKGITLSMLALFLSLFAVQDARAQTVITGTVTNEQGAPISGATVAIPTLGVGAQADASGNYRFTVPADRATGQTVTVAGRYIGFTPVQRTVVLVPGTQTVNFSLVADPSISPRLS
jgi:hypothetical protein